MVKHISYAELSIYLIRRIFYIVLVCLPILGKSQITINQNSLPDFGDTVLYKTDRKPTIDISPMGENQVWDFSSLTSPYVDEIVFSSPQSMSEKADMIVRQNGDLLFLLTWNKADLLISGQVNRDKLSQSESHRSHFSEPAVFRKNSLAYGDSFSEDYTQTTTYGINDISFEILNSLTQIPDSIRVIRKTHVHQDVDAWGNLFLPMSEDPVIRIKVDRTEEVNYIAIKDGLEIQIVEDRFTDRFAETKKSRNISYQFYSPTSKIPLVIIDTDERGEIQQAIYQINKEIYRGAQAFDVRKGLSVYPNPTFGPVRFDFYGYPPGTYQIRIFNTILKELWSDSYEIDHNGVVDVDLSFLQKGTYVYSIDNNLGERLLTKRLLIINP